MTNKRGLLSLFMVLFVVILPTAATLLWYQVSKDPYFRPLGITREALRAYTGFGGSSEITAYVDWVSPSTDEASRIQFERALRNAFRAKGTDVHVVFRDGDGLTTVTYQVGTSAIGPYPTGRAAEGISAAVEAYRMNPKEED